MSGEKQSHRVSAGGKAGGTASSAAEPQRKRRRWVLWIVVALVVLGALVFLLPYLVSTGPGTRLALSIANGRIDGRIEADDLSLTWLGPTRVKGLRVTDPAGREVVNVEEIEYALGVIQAARSWERLKQVSLEAPRLVLYVHKEGAGAGTSLEAAFRRADVPTEEPDEEAPLPPISGLVRIHGGSVRIVAADGRSVDIEDVTGEFDLARLEDVSGSLSVVLPGQGKLRATFDVKGLTRDGRLDLAGASGQVHLATDGQVDLGPLTEAAGAEGVRGRGRLTIDSAFSPEKLLMDVEVVLTGLTVDAGAARTVKPIEEIKLTGQVKLSGADARVDLELGGSLAKLKTGGSFRLDRPPLDVDAGKLVQAVLAGEPVTLPEFTFHADGSVNLAELAAATPHLLRVRRDVKVTGGTLEVKGLSIRGGASPQASGEVAVRGLTGERAGKPVAIAPLVASANVSSEPKTGLHIRSAGVTSDAVRAAASGTIQALQVTFDADLDKLRQSLSEFVELEGLTLAGQVGGAANVRSGDAGRLELAVNANAAGLKYAAGGARVNVKRATIAHSGVLTREAGKARRYTASSAEVTVNDAVKASGAGWYDLVDGSFQGTADLQRVELGELTSAVTFAEAGELAGYAGTGRGKVALRREAGDAAPIQTSGQLEIAGFRAAGEEVSAAPVQIEWEDVELGPDGSVRSARSVLVRSDFAKLDIKDASARLGDSPVLAGQFSLTADVARCLKVARGFVKGEKLPRVAGQLAMQGRCEVTGGRASFQGDGKVTDGQRVVLSLAGQGFHQAQTGAIGATVDLSAVDLAYVGAAARPFGPAGLGRLAGTVAGAVEIARAGAKAPVIAGGHLAGRDLAVDGKAIPGGQFKLRWVKAGYAPSARDVSVESLLLESDMAGVSASGVRVRWGGRIEATGKVDATIDLAACHAAAKPFLTGDAPAPSGWLSLTANVTAAGGRTDLTGSARVRELRRQGDDTGAAPAVEADLTGWYARDSGAFGGDANVSRADLGYLGRLGQTFGRRELAPYAGIVQVRSTFSRKASGAPIATSGAGKLVGLSVNGRAVGRPDATFEWSGAEIAPDGKRIALAAAKVTSAVASLTARDVRCDFGETFSANGSVGIGADLAQCVAVAAPIAGWKQPPAVRGMASFTAVVRSAGGAVDVAGTGKVDDFQYGTGAKVIQEKRIDLEVDGRLDPAAETITLKTFRINSKLLAATAAGTVGQYRTRRVLDLKGQYRAGWEPVLAVLHAFEPETAETILLTGEAASSFTASGPLRQEGLRPPFGRLAAGGNVGWASAKVYGVALEKAELAPRMAGGQLTLPEAVIGASGGKVHLGGVVDFTGEEPMLRIGRLQMMENVPVSVEVGELILSRFNPIFGKINVARLDGRMSLSLRDLAVPLSESIKQRGTGAGRLDMQTVTMAPTGPLGELVRLGGLADNAQAVQVSGTDFTIRDGRIWYKDFALIFAGAFDLHFSGSVGFDDSLDLVVRVPIRASLLAKLGVRGAAGQFAQALQGEYVSIPLRGTRAKPELDWKRVDIAPLIRKAAQSILTNGGKLPAVVPAPKPGPGEAPAPGDADPLQDILDMLKKGLEGKQKK